MYIAYLVVVWCMNSSPNNSEYYKAEEFRPCVNYFKKYIYFVQIIIEISVFFYSLTSWCIQTYFDYLYIVDKIKTVNINNEKD